MSKRRPRPTPTNPEPERLAARTGEPSSSLPTNDQADLLCWCGQIDCEICAPGPCNHGAPSGLCPYCDDGKPEVTYQRGVTVTHIYEPDPEACKQALLAILLRSQSPVGLARQRPQS